MKFQLGDWEVESVSGEIARDGELRRIEPKPMEVLVYLARHAGEVVSKDELMSRVWSGTVVGEDSLWRSVYGLRKAFGEEPPERRYVETVPRRGYRLVAPVSSLEPTAEVKEAAPGEVPLEATPSKRSVLVDSLRSAVRWSVPAVLALALLLWAGSHPRSREAAAEGGAKLESERAWSIEEGRPASEFFELGRAYYDGQVSRHVYSSAELDRAIELFDKAVARDPSFALARAELAGARALRAARAGCDLVEIRAASASLRDVDTTESCS